MRKMLQKREVGIVVLPNKEPNTMKNCEMKVECDILTITVDLSKKFGESASGKSIITGTTSGNVSVPGKEDVKVGVNVYRRQ